MFNTMQRQLNRKQPTGKALVVRRVMIGSIFFFTFLFFQLIQMDKLSTSLDTQYRLIQESTASNSTQFESTLAQYEEKFENTDAFYADENFDTALFDGRLEENVTTEAETAKQEAIGAQGQVILFDIFKWVIPGAVSTVDDHEERITEYFEGDEYLEYITTSQKIKDLNAGIQYCLGTPLGLDREGDGYLESALVTEDERNQRMTLIHEAADRTICDTIDPLEDAVEPLEEAKSDQ